MSGRNYGHGRSGGREPCQNSTKPRMDIRKTNASAVINSNGEFECNTGGVAISNGDLNNTTDSGIVLSSIDDNELNVDTNDSGIVLNSVYDNELDVDTNDSGIIFNSNYVTQNDSNSTAVVVNSSGGRRRRRENANDGRGQLCEVGNTDNERPTNDEIGVALRNSSMKLVRRTTKNGKKRSLTDGVYFA